MFLKLFATIIMVVAPLIAPQQPSRVNLQNASAAEIIQTVNNIRLSKGLPALKTNAILMNTAQYTADLMATQMAKTHIGNMKDRIIIGGYGAGYPSSSIWGTENFAIGEGNETAQQIVLGSWSDDVHMIPMTNSHYCDVGAGVSQAGNGTYYYVLHAAYNNDVACGKNSTAATDTGAQPATDSAPQWIIPVNRATPDQSGKIIHIVRQGQSLWSIAIAYGTRINSILALNNLSMDTKSLYNGERLIIPTSLTPLPTETETAEATDTAIDTPVLTVTPTNIVSTSQYSETPKPSITPTVDPTSQAETDERFRGGLFIALVIILILITAALLLRR